MKTEFTPGPWNEHEAYRGSKPLFVSVPYGQDFLALTVVIAHDQVVIGEAKTYLPSTMCGFPHVETEQECRANARLMIAAPALFSALDDLLLYVDLYDGKEFDPSYFDPKRIAMRAAAAAARAALDAAVLPEGGKND